VAKVAGFIAILLASINIFGGFAITRRMLEMFDGNKKGGRK
jgi:NAD(P) transhydrogenase subunit alpha